MIPGNNEGECRDHFEFHGAAVLGNGARASARQHSFSAWWLCVQVFPNNPNEEIAGALPPLRQDYLNEVRAIAQEVEDLRNAGRTPEEIARIVHAKRRELGIKYKDLTPP
jgi:hypothetical protein